MYQVGSGGRCLEEIRGYVARLGEEIQEGDEPSTYADIDQAIRKLTELKGYVTEYFQDRKANAWQGQQYSHPQYDWLSRTNVPRYQGGNLAPVDLGST